MAAMISSATCWYISLTRGLEQVLASARKAAKSRGRPYLTVSCRGRGQPRSCRRRQRCRTPARARRGGDLMTARPMPERAGCSWPSRVRVPSGNRMMAPPRSSRSRMAFNPRPVPPSRSTGTTCQERNGRRNGKTEKRGAGQIIDCPLQARAHQRRIQKTGVVARQNDRPDSGTVRD